MGPVEQPSNPSVYPLQGDPRSLRELHVRTSQRTKSCNTDGWPVVHVVLQRCGLGQTQALEPSACNHLVRLIQGMGALWHDCAIKVDLLNNLSEPVHFCQPLRLLSIRWCGISISSVPGVTLRLRRAGLYALRRIPENCESIPSSKIRSATSSVRRGSALNSKS